MFYFESDEYHKQMGCKLRIFRKVAEDIAFDNRLETQIGGDSFILLFCVEPRWDDFWRPPTHLANAVVAGLREFVEFEL